MKRRCIIGQSGGPTAVINASLAGIIKRAYQKNFDKVYGMINGIEGLLQERIIDLHNVINDKNINQLAITPAMFLGSCRFKILENDDFMMSKIFDILKKYEITDFFYIGGNDSMDTIMKLNEYAKKTCIPINFIGIPKTIDNDLTNIEYTPGYPSACHYIVTSLLEVAFDSAIYSSKSITIIEIMGRDTGWLTASAEIVNQVYPDTVDLIYMPEISFRIDEFINDIQKKLKVKNNLIIAIGEGLKDDNGQMITLDQGIPCDDFGHMSSNGCSYYLKEVIMNKIKVKTRVIQLSTLQRCAAHLVSQIDFQNAICLGKYAVDCALDKRTGIMVNIVRSRNEFLYGSVNIETVANQVKKFPLEWIDMKNKKIKKEFIEYIVPLIYENYEMDLPRFLKMDKL